VKIRLWICGALLTVLVMAAPAAHAQTYGSPSPVGHSQWREMRQETMAACAHKSPGTACSLSSAGQALGGICRATQQGQLACRTGEAEPGFRMRGPTGGGMPWGNGLKQ
jgi:hypothetical protein